MALINIEHDPDRVGARPVFFDHKGHRWNRIRIVVVVALLGIVWALVTVIPQVVAPLWLVAFNRGVDVPGQIVNDVQATWPVIGTGELVRVIDIQRRGDVAFATDPFSSTVFHRLSPDDAEIVRGRSYAVEKYSAVPDKTLIITFDDGPDPRWTPKILDVLAAEGVQGTFFDIGTNMTKNPQLVQREAREGHLVGNHTLTHVDFDKVSGSIGRQEWLLSDHISRAIESTSTKFVRPPYISCNADPEVGVADSRRAILTAQQLGYYSVCHDLDTDDWSWPAGHPDKVPDFSNGAGHVVLMHDAGGDRSMSVTYLADMIHAAKAQGYRFSTVAALAPQGGFEAPQRVAPTVADQAAYWTAKSVLVVPGMVVSFLFDLNVGMIGVLTLATLGLAIIGTIRARRRWWNLDYQPLVSVVVAAYNEEKVLAATLAAIASSKYRNYEVIVVNDGSTDRTLEIAVALSDEWARQGRVLQVMHQANAGKWAALNNGIAHANSDIVVTLDADTLVTSSTIGYLVRHFEDPAVGAVAGVVKVGNVHNLVTAWQSLDYISGIATDRTAQGVIGGIMIVPGACAAWRKAAVLAAGGYSSATLAEDQDLTLAIQRVGFTVVQENRAIGLTEAPSTGRDLIKQRFRWTFGSLQALWKNRRMFLNPRYGMLGMVVMPYTAISILIPLMFMPVTYALLAETVIAGNGAKALGYAALFLTVHLVTTIAAVIILRERWWHVVIVPFYRLVNEPLRAYLLYATTLSALRGRAVGWNKVARTGGVGVRQVRLRAVKVES